MNEEIKSAIRKSLGNADAPSFIGLMESIRNSDNISQTERGFSFPVEDVEDIEVLQEALYKLSSVGRAFPITLKDGLVIIDTKTMKELSADRREAFFQWMPETERVLSWGIREQHVELPPIARGSKVLDIGAGTGFLSGRIRDSLDCDVYALEPSFERESDYDSCVQVLGETKVHRMTLQEALESFPEEFYHAFDAVTVFKYNVPGTSKEEFIAALSQIVKPDGVVYITSVEPERFTFSRQAGELIYLTDTINKYFEHSDFVTRDSFYGADQLMTITGPKLELVSTPQFK